MRTGHERSVVVLLAVALLAGCGSSSPPSASASAEPRSSQAAIPTPRTPSAPPVAPTASPTIGPSPSAPAATAPAPTPTSTASQAATDPFVGKVVATVSDDLVVRSEPRVSDDSVMYAPWLPIGTELLVLDGPVRGSGYTWYKVAPISFAGLGGPGYGWVAMAGRDGDAWIALAQGPIGPNGVALAQSNVARANADPEDAKTAATSITAFGLDLYRALLADPSLKLGTRNVVFSPTSIALALGMARAGAKGETAAEIDQVLHTSGWDSLGAGLNALDQALRSRNATWRGSFSDREGTFSLALRIANAVFAQRGWTIEESFLDAIAAAFGAGLRLVDYVADPDAARLAINGWVSDQTAGRIPDLLTPPDVTSVTRLALVNAVYLKGEWDDWFDEAETKPAPFTRLDGSRVKVPTMQRHGGWGVGTQPIAYAKGTGWQAAELRYKAPDPAKTLAMTIILPDDLPAFERGLTASKLTRIATTLEAERDSFYGGVDCGEFPSDGGCYPYDVELSMPRFAIETTADLKGSLRTLGMDQAFDPVAADFTGIHVPKSGMDRLYVYKVVQQANIDVDEKGTEAAAASAVMGATGGGPMALKQITVRLDHPFLFVVRDVEIGAILFIGRVVDPSVKG